MDQVVSLLLVGWVGCYGFLANILGMHATGNLHAVTKLAGMQAACKPTTAFSQPSVRITETHSHDSPIGTTSHTQRRRAGLVIFPA